MNDSHASEVALSRVVDRTDRPDDWRSLRQAAVVDGDLWRDLAELLELDCELRASAPAMLAPADRVALPVTGSTFARLRHAFLPERRDWFGIAGWLAAVCVLVLWLGDRQPSLVTPAPNDAHEGAPVAAEHATWQVGELPPLLVEAEPRANGGYDVLWVRRTLEQAQVDALYGLAFDEGGQPTPVPMTPSRPRPTREF
jgi:hypothetical protein